MRMMVAMMVLAGLAGACAERAERPDAAVVADADDRVCEEWAIDEAHPEDLWCRRWAR